VIQRGWVEQEAPTAEEMAGLTESWRPYRSLGSYYMWLMMDKKSASQKAAEATAKANSKAMKSSKVPM